MVANFKIRKSNSEKPTHTVKKTDPDIERTKASRIDYSNGEKNVILKGPLAEVVSKALNELYRLKGEDEDNETGVEVTQESVYDTVLNGKGFQLVVDSASNNMNFLVYCVYQHNCSIDDLFVFSNMNKESAKTSVHVILMDGGIEANVFAETLIELAKIKHVKVFNDIKSLIDDVLNIGESVEEDSLMEDTDIETDDLDEEDIDTKEVIEEEEDIADFSDDEVDEEELEE